MGGRVRVLCLEVARIDRDRPVGCCCYIYHVDASGEVTRTTGTTVHVLVQHSINSNVLSFFSYVLKSLESWSAWH